MDENFSQQLKDLIAESRIVSLDLGYDYISTLHFFIADCKLNYKHSIKNFAFTSNEEFQNFYSNQREGEPSTFDGDLHLTIEAAKTVKKALKLWNHSYYFDTQICTYHLFLAASLISNSVFCSIFPDTKELYQQLEKYYIETGQINKDDINSTFWLRLKRRVF